jgi:predicted O-linked N-acetylglucosamine transferase (SPINDLY family)
LPATGTLFLCPQTPQKFHPDFDVVLHRILEADPTSHLVLTAGWSARPMAVVTRRLLADAPHLASRVHVLGPMNRQSFIGLCQACDIILDPLHYSGGNSSLEAFASGAPVVTWPGRVMRARHSYGFYQLMGVSEGVAADHNDYVRLALRWSGNAEERALLRRRLHERSARLYEDDRPVRAMEAYFSSIAPPG